MNDDAVEADRQLFVRIAKTDPGLVRTMSLLVGELADCDLEPALLRALGERVRRLGDTMIMRADRLQPGPTVIDQNGN